ncbi:energy transducer TonB [Methylotenera sp. N17]|uniref:energy transducer TonB n=1 Tax=Methylotenera sp. N17 TaxID=1502761 RepID=UPI0013635608|nr:energy transducer TonB [Methylotenera sp. N17]
MKINFALAFILLSLTAWASLNTVEAFPVKRKQVLTGEYTNVAASDKAPKVIFRINPIYPAKFINSGIEGRVKVFFVVDIQGIPVQVQYIEATDLAFAQEAINAVKEWRFEPALKDGVAVPACVVASIVFLSNASNG